MSGRGRFSTAFNRMADTVDSLRPVRAPGLLTNHRLGGVSRSVIDQPKSDRLYPLTLGIVDIVRPQTRNPDGSVTTAGNRILICRQFTSGMVYTGRYYAVEPPDEFDTVEFLNVPDIGSTLTTDTDADYTQVSVTRDSDNIRTVHYLGDPIAFSSGHVLRPNRDIRQIWWPRYRADVIIRAFPSSAPSIPAGNGTNNDPALITGTHRFGEAMVQNYFDMNTDARRWVPRYEIAADALAYRPARYEDEVLVQAEIEAGVFDGDPPTDFES